MADDYKYDVAFSFLAQDESLATALNDLLQDRLQTFLYSKRQEELAGTDGEQSFGKVFSEEARCVVVIYRTGWGETPWTRIEETAIRNRAFDEGYDFVLFIPLDGSGVPRWLPKAQLWLGLDRWGKKGAASVIEARVQEQGGETRQESVEDRARRLKRSLDFKEARKRYLGSGKAVADANAEFEALTSEILRHIEVIKKAMESEKYLTKSKGPEFVVLGPQNAMGLYWRCRYSNTLDDSEFEAALYKGHPPMWGVQTIGQPTRRESFKADFDLLASDQPGWTPRCAEKRQFLTAEFAEYLVKWFMDDAERS